MAKIIGIAVAVVVFLIWQSLIGNPHFIETIIGVVISGGAGLWAYRTAKKLRNSD